MLLPDVFQEYELGELKLGGNHQIIEQNEENFTITLRQSF